MRQNAAVQHVPRDLLDCPIVRKYVVDGRVHDADGAEHTLTCQINPTNAATLYRVIRDTRPHRVIEIGDAFGASTVVILKALADNGCGTLVSIDPYVNFERAERVARHSVAIAGHSSRHTFVKDFSYLALPDITRSGRLADFVYIDGMHTYDYAFTDAFLADKALHSGGILAFNDCGWHSVRRAINNFRADNAYEELRDGIPRSYRGSSWAKTLVRWMLGWNTLDRYFRKAGK